MTPEDVARFRAGDHDLFEQLVARHSPQLLGVAMRLTEERATAHDLVHDAWVRGYERRATFSGGGSFVGWMLAVLRSCHHDAIRSDTRRDERALAYARELHAHEHATNADGMDRETVQIGSVLDALSMLTERQRDVVVMRLVEGRSVADTAAALAVAEGTVKATLAQALTRLRALLAPSRP